LAGTLELVQWMRRPSSGSATPTNAPRTITRSTRQWGNGTLVHTLSRPCLRVPSPLHCSGLGSSGRTAGVSSHHRRMKQLDPPASFRSSSLGMVGACVETPATRFAALPVDDTLSPMLSLRVAYRRPHRVPRRVLLVSVGGAKNGRLVEPLCHNLQTNGQRVPGEAAGDGYSGNTG
jgi:hypothetical protein